MPDGLVRPETCALAGCLWDGNTQMVVASPVGTCVGCFGSLGVGLSGLAEENLPALYVLIPNPVLLGAACSDRLDLLLTYVLLSKPVVQQQRMDCLRGLCMRSDLSCSLLNVKPACRIWSGVKHSRNMGPDLNMQLRSTKCEVARSLAATCFCCVLDAIF